MATATASWGEEIAEVQVRGVPFRMYAERPRRVEQLLAFADRWGARPHVVQGERVVTFEALRRAVAAKAAALEDLGVARGERVMILGWTSPDWIVNFWGCLACGAVPVLANAWWSESELADALTRLRPALTLADAHSARKLPAGWACGPWDTAADGAAPELAEDGDEDDPAVIIFTSGTEGRSKAVVLSHRALLAGLQMLLHITRRLPHQVDETSRDVGLQTGPLFHIGGIQTLLRGIMVGSTLVIPNGRFDPADVLELIERHEVTRWSAVPTMVTRLLDHPDVRRRDLHTLRSLTVGGAPVHSELLHRIRTELPSVQARIATGYGLTENGGQATAASGKDTASRPGSSGRPLPCVDLKIAADGEILVRSPTQMSGYSGDEDSPIDRDGWLHTGDLGEIDDGGHLWITGRCKDMIIRGGENIAPALVERALLALHGVAEAAVVGVAHPDLGEEVMAIVRVEGEHTPDGLRDQLRGTVASFAVPTRWKLRTTPFPLNHAGKVDKGALRAEMGV